jgi:hypothetical protein
LIHKANLIEVRFFCACNKKHPTRHSGFEERENRNPYIIKPVASQVGSPIKALGDDMESTLLQIKALGDGWVSAFLSIKTLRYVAVNMDTSFLILDRKLINK